MKKLFSVTVDGVATSQQRDAFTNALRTNTTIGFWHHLSHSWLIVDPHGVFTATTLSNLLHSHIPNVPSMIIEGPTRDYQGFVNQIGHGWLRDNIDAKNWNPAP